MKNLNSFFLFLITFLFLTISCNRSNSPVLSDLTGVSAGELHNSGLEAIYKLYPRGVFSESEAFETLINFHKENNPEIIKVYQELGLSTTEHNSFHELYYDKFGKFPQLNTEVQKYYVEMVNAQQSSNSMADFFIRLDEIQKRFEENIKDEIVLNNLRGTLSVFKHSTEFWTNIKINSNIGLGEAQEGTITRDQWDALHYAQTYDILRQMGNSHEYSHLVASNEAAYQSATCRICDKQSSFGN